MKNKVLYVVPSIDKKNSGPAVRVNNIIQSKFFDSIIFGNMRSKIVSSLKVPFNSLVYVESSTNRLNIVDFFCLVFLKYVKSCDLNIYIRDCYTMVFPEEYARPRKKVTKLLLDLTNIFFIKISSKLYFPTLDMGNLFCEYYRINKNIGDLPPGIVKSEFDSFNFTPIKLEATKYIIHVGGLQYRYSGLDELLDFSINLDAGIKVLLVTRDKDLFFSHRKYKQAKGKVEVISLNRDGIANRVRQGDVIGAIHSRPINDYDAITFPIKILDYISWKLPIITLLHKPIIDLLGNDYPFYFEDLQDFSYEKYLKSYSKVEGIYIDLAEKKNYSEIMKRLVV